MCAERSFLPDEVMFIAAFWLPWHIAARIPPGEKSNRVEHDAVISDEHRARRFEFSTPRHLPDGLRGTIEQITNISSGN
jgi:hypothetical protein